MTICGIATLPARENNLKLVLQAISPQVDRVYVALNGHKEIPSWHGEFDNVYCEIFSNSLGDAMKAAWAFSKGNYYLPLDDDLQVPEGYVDYMIDGVNKYNGLVSLHGKIYLPDFVSFKRWAGNYRCLGSVSEDITHINLIGSGICAFHTDRLRVSLADFKRPNMADVFLSKLASDQGVSMVVLKHDIGYLKYLEPPDSTIWQNTRDYSYHESVMRTFIK
jgi:glycosyltransferase involved in cell wall biosynthesis